MILVKKMLRPVSWVPPIRMPLRLQKNRGRRSHLDFLPIVWASRAFETWVLKWQLFQRFCLLVSGHFAALGAFPSSPLSIRSGNNRPHFSDAKVSSFRGLRLTGLFKLPFNPVRYLINFWLDPLSWVRVRLIEFSQSFIYEKLKTLYSDISCVKNGVFIKHSFLII